MVCEDLVNRRALGLAQVRVGPLDLVPRDASDEWWLRSAAGAHDRDRLAFQRDHVGCREGAGLIATELFMLFDIYLKV